MDSTNFDRVKKLNGHSYKKGSVLYLIQRDFRAEDNHALDFAYHLSKEKNASIVAATAIEKAPPGGNKRQLRFKVEGIKLLEKDLREKGISLFALTGSSIEGIKNLVSELSIKAIVTDFDPLRETRLFQEQVAKSLPIPFYVVDAHNIVPCWHVSDKEEYGAYTFRPKINRLLDKYLAAPLYSVFQSNNPYGGHKIDWDKIEQEIAPHTEICSLSAGGQAAKKCLNEFMHHTLPIYNEKRNDPNAGAQSDISPYLHFGHISSKRILETLTKEYGEDENYNAYVEELVIRKELSDNFCYYNPSYDVTEAFKSWAIESLKKHSKDPRDYLYTMEGFEQAETHDELWNAAQKEMVVGGKMHGYMRMYWAKKILEWSQTPEDALHIALTLNNKYELDGNDPNGYAGCAWSIGGIHDRAWKERGVFGKVRYMNYNGCKRKFDVDLYIKTQMAR